MPDIDAAETTSQNAPEDEATDEPVRDRGRPEQGQGARAGRFVEHPLGGPALGLWTAAVVMRSTVAASGVAFVVGVFLALGVIEESSFGVVSGAVDVDELARVWIAVIVFGGVAVVGVASVFVSSAARWALHRHLTRVAAEPGAESAVPVAWQRQVATTDPLDGMSALAFVTALVGAVLGFVTLIAAVGAALDGDVEAVAIEAVLVVVCVVLTVAGILVQRALGRRDRTGGLAAAVWDGAAVARARSASHRGEEVATERSSTPVVLRFWLSTTGARIVGVLGGMVVATGIVLLFIRKPGRHADEQAYGPGVEHGIDGIWRVLVLVGVGVLVAFVVGWLAVLTVDAWCTRMLARRARATPRVGVQVASPPERVLQTVLEGTSPARRLGRALVAVAAVGGSLSVSALVVGSEQDTVAASDTLAVARLGVVIALGALALGALAIGMGLGRGRRRREQIRAAWPITEATPPQAD